MATDILPKDREDTMDNRSMHLSLRWVMDTPHPGHNPLVVVEEEGVAEDYVLDSCVVVV